MKRFSYNIFHSKLGIQAKIFVTFALLMLVTILGITSIWYNNIIITIKNNATTHAIDVIKKTNLGLDGTMTDLENIVKIISNNQNIIELLHKKENSNKVQAITDYMESFFALKQESIYGISIVDLKGHIYKVGTPYIPSDYLERDWVNSIINGNGESVFTVKNIYTSTKHFDPTRQCYITIGRAIIDKYETIGFVTIDIRLSIIINAYSSNLMNGIATSFVVDKDTNLIFCNNYSIEIEEIDDFLYMLSNNNKEYKTVNCKIKDVPQIVISNTSKVTNWTTVIFIPLHILQKPYLIAIKQTIFSAIIFFGLALLLSIFISSNITRKLKKLRDTITLFQSGKYHNQSSDKIIYSNDEVGQLANAFTEMISTIQKQMEDLENSNNQKRHYEIEALEAQINPHFLYNTLNTIKYLADIQNVENISEVSLSLIDLLKYSISDKKKFVKIKDEVNHIKNYLNIQQYKYFYEIKIIYDIEEDILNCKTIKMILQPFVENSLKHGLQNSDTSDGYLIIKGCRIGNDIEFNITDNGIGISQEKINLILSSIEQKSDNRFGGIGIQNVNKRIKLFFGKEYGVNIFSIKDIQTIITIKIPAIEEGDTTYAI